MPHKVLQPTYSTRFNDFALEFYSFVVADNYAPFYSRPIECTDRDALFVLDGMLYHESDLDLEENGARLEGHMATLDTHAIARTLTDTPAPTRSSPTPSRPPSERQPTTETT